MIYKLRNSVGHLIHVYGIEDQALEDLRSAAPHWYLEVLDKDEVVATIEQKDL